MNIIKQWCKAIISSSWLSLRLKLYHREIVARIAAADGSHYGRNVRRKIGFSPRPTPSGPRRKEGYKWNTTHTRPLELIRVPGHALHAYDRVSLHAWRVLRVSRTYERTTWYVHAVDYIINVVTTLRLFAPRDQRGGNLLISRPATAPEVPMYAYACVCTLFLPALFQISCLREGLLMKATWPLQRAILHRDCCVSLYYQLNCIIVCSWLLNFSR